MGCLAPEINDSARLGGREESFRLSVFVLTALLLVHFSPDSRSAVPGAFRDKGAVTQTLTKSTDALSLYVRTVIVDTETNNSDTILTKHTCVISKQYKYPCLDIMSN